MKRFLSLLLAIILVFSLSACEKGESTSDMDTSTQMKESKETSEEYTNNDVEKSDDMTSDSDSDDSNNTFEDSSTASKPAASTTKPIDTSKPATSIAKSIDTSKPATSTAKSADNTEHREKCHVSGCDEIAYQKGVCVSHLFEVCQEDDCYKLRVDGSFNCVDHTCHYSGCTYRANDNPNFYCNIHWYELQRICIVEGCTAYKVYNSEYCNEHQMLYICNHLNCQNKLDGSSRYCKTHKCNISSCAEEKSVSSNYCTRHTCSYGSCKNPTSGYVSNTGSTYCNTHKCKAQGCYNGKSINSDYCIYHYR